MNYLVDSITELRIFFFLANKIGAIHFVIVTDNRITFFLLYSSPFAASHYGMRKEVS